MSLTAGLVENLKHDVERSLELSAVLEQRKEGRQLLGAEEMLLADALLDVLSVADCEAFLLAVVGDCDEFAVCRNLKARCLCECLCADCNRVRKPVACLVPLKRRIGCNPSPWMVAAISSAT
ncbi:MAG: hypothetical protein IJQ70_07105 [Synergistaceae bacterium]|nr:hypothetical protein [Synergistaceae bacterium]